MNVRITRLISAAEKCIEAQEYPAALRHLAAAEEIEPDNKSIRMIRELVRSLQNEQERKQSRRRFLSVTVDPRSPTGVSRRNEQAEEDTRRRIHEFTTTAKYFLASGAIDNAFESLMHAYLLDPVSPAVLECEKLVLPAWERLHGKSSAEAKEDWKMKFAAEAPTRISSLFDRLKQGKFLP